MTINPNWPLTVTSVAFTTDPFDQSATPVYTDLSLRAQDFSCSIGKQYELDTGQAGEATYTMLDPDEALNPSNPYSPFRVGNLLVNLSYDPTFESYTAGTTPSWITGVGVTPTISTTNPFQGANDLAFTTSVSGTPQGVTFAATGLTVGYQYTASAYVRKETGTDTVQISVASGPTGLTQTVNAQYNRLVVMFTATATSHTVQILTTAGPTGANVVRVDAVQLEYSFAPSPFSTLPEQSLVKVYRQIADQAMWPPLPVGGNANLFNSVWGNITNQVIDPTFESYTNGSTPSFVLTTGGVTPTVTTTNPFQGTQDLTFSILGNSVEQGVGWTFPTMPGQSYVCSVYVRQSAANTMVAFINGGATGTSTTTTGAYVRLSVSWTASNTTHQFWVASITPTLASTVNIDAIQVEPVQPLSLNYNMLGGTANWTANNCTLASSSLWSVSDQYSLQLVATGGFAAAFAEGDKVAVSPSTLYKIQGTMYAPNGSGTAVAGIRCDWFTSGGVYITTSLGSEQALVPGVPQAFGFTDTSPSNAAFGSIQVSLTNTPTAGITVYADDVQLLSATPTTFSSTGPTIFGVFHGYVERWPSSWNYNGTYGLALITCVDAFAPMAGQNLWTEYRNSVLAKNPTYYWPLSEAQSTTSFAEVSGNNGPALTPLNSQFGAGPTFAAGTSMNVAGDPSGTGLASNTGTVGTNVPATVAQTNSLTGIGGTPPVAYSYAFWLIHSTPSPLGGQTEFGVEMNNINGSVINDVFTADTPSVIGYFCAWPGSAGGTLQTTSDVWLDGKPHLIVLTVSVGVSTGTVTMYIDGTQVLTSTASSSGALTTPSFAQVGGLVNPASFNSGAAIAGGIYSHFAIWNRALSASEVTDLWNAGKGYPSESSGQRIQRYLGYHYVAPSALDGGASVMGVSNLAAGTSLLDATQAVTTSENGNLFVNPGGQVTFQARTRRYLYTTASWIFGENQAGGEIPYNGDIDFDYDPTQVFNDVSVDNAGGIKAVGGTQSAIAASQRKYGRRSYSRTVNVSDLEAQDAANWLFAAHQDPVQRLNQATINPAANPSMWLAALGLRIGDRSTFRRRTTIFIQQADFFNERIEHSRAAGQWLVTYQMSPATFAVNLQPGIFNDTTYGCFDTTMRFGY